jgi:hypothetical protein
MLESDGNLRLVSANHIVISTNPTPIFCKQQKELHWIQMLNLNWIQFILILCCSFSSLFFFHFSYLLFLLMFLYLIVFLLILRPTSFSYYHDLILLLLLLFHSGFCFWLFSFLFSAPFLLFYQIWCWSVNRFDNEEIHQTEGFGHRKTTYYKNVQDRANSRSQPRRDCLISHR